MRSASASSTLCWTSGESRSNRRNPVAVITSRRDGSVTVTLAVVGRSETSAISPKKSPLFILLIFRPFRRTSAAPSVRMKNWRPRSPSAISSLAAGTLTSSASCAILTSWLLESPPNNGTSLISSTFWFFPNGTARVYAGRWVRATGGARRRHLVHVCDVARRKPRDPEDVDRPRAAAQVERRLALDGFRIGHRLRRRSRAPLLDDGGEAGRVRRHRQRLR